jgi:peptidoglycan/LPS O-acetylase OafA/YrhL
MTASDASSLRSSIPIPQIDALRGIAICLVFLRHSYGFLYGSISPTEFWPAIMMSGHTGVTLFFVLSGFLLSRPFLEEAAGGVRVIRSAYFIRRIFRIMPLYVIAIALAVVARTNDPMEMVRLAVPYLCFLQLVPGASTPMPLESLVWWSLATEVQFYLLLPLLPLALRSASGRRVGTMLLLAYVAVYGLFAVGLLQGGAPRTRHFIGHSIFGRAWTFGFGILAAAFIERYGEPVAAWMRRPALGRAQRCDLVLLAIVAVLTALLRVIGPIDYIELERNLPAWHVPEALLWTALLTTLLLSQSALARVMVNPVTLAIGVLSYSIFLVHMPLLVHGSPLVRHWLPGSMMGSGQLHIGAWLAIALVVMVVSSLTYRMIERPAIKLGARVARSRTARERTASLLAKDQCA